MKPRAAHKPRKFLDEEERQELRQLRGEGWTLPELAEKFGIGLATAFRIANNT